MVTVEEPSPEKSRTEDKRRTKEQPVWYQTSWGVLIAIFFFLAVFFLIWADRAKPVWLKIEVSNCDVALVAVAFTYLFQRFLRVKSRSIHWSEINSIKDIHAGARAEEDCFARCCMNIQRPQPSLI